MLFKTFGYGALSIFYCCVLVIKVRVVGKYGLLGVVVASPPFFSPVVGGVIIVRSRDDGGGLVFLQGGGNRFWPFSVCVSG